MPPEYWAHYWSKPAPIQEAKPAPTEFEDIPEMQNTGRLTIDEFVRRNGINALTADLVSAADTYQVIASRDGERTVLSTLLCQAHKRLENKHMTRIEHAKLVAQQERTQLQFTVLEIQPLACDAPPVTQLLDCLTPPPKRDCMTNRELAAQVHAAKKLAP